MSSSRRLSFAFKASLWPVSVVDTQHWGGQSVRGAGYEEREKKFVHLHRSGTVSHARRELCLPISCALSRHTKNVAADARNGPLYCWARNQCRPGSGPTCLRSITRYRIMEETLYPLRVRLWNPSPPGYDSGCSSGCRCSAVGCNPGQGSPCTRLRNTPVEASLDG